MFAQQNFKQSLFQVTVILVAISALTACGRSSSEATVKLAFENTDPSQRFSSDRASTLATSGMPTAFSMKLIAAYITADVDPVSFDNVGITSIFYLNDDCNDDISHCDIDPGTAEDGEPMSQVVTSFFDLHSPAAVNAALNSQGRTVATGSYKYVRLEFCKYASGSSENIRWNYGTIGEQSFRRTMCSVNSAEMNPPLTLAEGETVTITLGYDLSDAVQVGADASGDDCVGDGAGKTCFYLPTFTPSVSR